MMNRNDRLHIILERLSTQFDPDKLEVIDDSDKHIGHAGAAGGAGHYTVIISADAFQHDASRVDIHREIYRVLDDLIPQEVHALQIKLV
jgi:BolA protein